MGILAKLALTPLCIAAVSITHSLRGANKTLSGLDESNSSFSSEAEQASPHGQFEGVTDANGPKPDWVDNPLAEYFFHYTEGPKIWKWHHYFRVYHKHLARYQAMAQAGTVINLLVVGVQSGGEVGMWRNYFGDSLHFTGIDINPACKQIETWHPNTKIHTGDQGDAAFLTSVVSALPTPHIIIDDGSHVNAHQILTFETYFPYLDKNGVYIVEDVTTSYSKPGVFHRSVSTEGLPLSDGPDQTLIEHMKVRADYVNGYWASPEYAETMPFVKAVDSIAFYDGMVVVEKRPHPHPQQEQRGTKEIPYCTAGQANGCKR